MISMTSTTGRIDRLHKVLDVDRFVASVGHDGTRTSIMAPGRAFAINFVAVHHDECIVLYSNY